MMDTPLEHAQLKVERHVLDWEAAMDLGWLSISHIYVPATCTEDESTMAETQADWEYRQAEIYWYLPRLAILEDNDLDNTIVHELVHVLTNSMESVMKRADQKLVEFAVTSVTRSIVAVRHSTNSPRWRP